MNYLHKFSLLALAVILFSGILTAESANHVVGKGETIYSISRRYGITADELMRANNITDPSTLQAGRLLVIPSSAASLPPASVPASTQSTISTTNYKVVKGDTLFSIAKNNGIDLATLLDINKFSSNHVIKTGDVIKVPTRTVPAQNNASGNSSSTATQSTAAQIAAGVYALRWPVTPKDISYMTGQMGVVVEGEHNESVKSLTQGNVISAGPWRKFGRVVIVETTGGYFYMYGGCETLSVRAGDKITPGTEVGKLGINTVSSKPQLFFMVFRKDTPIDPVKAPRAGERT